MDGHHRDAPKKVSWPETQGRSQSGWLVNQETLQERLATEKPHFDNPAIDVRIFKSLNFYVHVHTYMYVTGWIVKGAQFCNHEKSPASSGIPQEGVDFPGIQFLGSTSRQKPSYRHPRARVPIMLSMVHVNLEYSCTNWLYSC